MALTPHKTMIALRRGAILGALAAGVALVGPFRYSDLGLPFPDTIAHAILFYGLTVGAMAALPRSRATDIALTMTALAAGSELAQMTVGREASVHDTLGDLLGVAVAYVPVAVGRLRELTRLHPHTSFAEIRRNDPRRRRNRVHPAPQARPVDG
jgi:VanZ family protein